MSSGRESVIFDALYGDVQFDSVIADLIACPLVQRLRQVRLSNIDSISMPGISSITRYEHALGAAYLATQTGLWRSLSDEDRLLLQAAALIHDTAITPFGHLAEEALAYLDTDFDHEKKWSVLIAGSDSSDIGGSNLQLFLGHRAGLQEWVYKAFGKAEFLTSIVGTINARGKFGKLIAGEMDLDNLDNVSRIAHHMGLDKDRKLPQRIARSIVGVTPEGTPMLSDHALPLVDQWLECRRLVYERLMLSTSDFVGKIMLLFAAVTAFKTGRLSLQDWKMYDSEFVSRLSSADEKDISETVKRWLLGDLWDLAPLLWMQSNLPKYSAIYEFSQVLSRELGRTSFAYRIKDKRTRSVNLRLESKREVRLGASPKQWLLGFASPKKFTSQEIRLACEVARKFFELEEAPIPHSTAPTLFQPV
jgi:HD superfamily phosphohydrolase